MDKKRIALIAIFVLISIVLGFIIYRLFFSEEGGLIPKQPIPTITTTPTPFPTTGAGVVGRPGVPTETTLPTAGVQPGQAGFVSTVKPKETKVVDARITSPSVDKSGTARFYNQNDGKFYRVNSDGTISVLSDQVFYNVQKVTWSPSNNESIIEYPDGSNIYYNFQTKQQVTLPKHWEEFSFAPAGDKIAAKNISLSPENRWIISSNPDGSDIKFIENMGENAPKVTVSWSPTRKVVALSQTGDPLGSDRQSILLIGQNHENFKSLTVEGRGFQSQWSPNGAQLLYSVYSQRSDYKPELWIVNADGDNIDTNRQPVFLNTWASKCTFADTRYVYCGVPAQLETGAGFRPEIADTMQDQLYKIDLNTGTKTIINTDNAHTIDQIFVSNDGKTLNFTDKNQNGIFSVNL